MAHIEKITEKVQAEIEAFNQETHEGELWHEIIGWHKYYVSNYSNVWSFKTHKYRKQVIDGKLSKDEIYREGYNFVSLSQWHLQQV